MEWLSLAAEQTVTTNVYPFEFIIEIFDTTKNFTYNLIVTKKITGATITPIKN